GHTGAKSPDTIESGRRSGVPAPVRGGAALRMQRRRWLRELLAHELADDGAVGPTGNLRHDVRHDAAELAQARCPDLGDDVVDDALELGLGKRLGHELLEHVELRLLRLRL